MKLSSQDILLALVAIACGGSILLIATGVIDVEPTAGTPHWVVGLAGLAFVIAGFMIFLRHHSRALDLMAAILLGAFTLMAAWVTFDSSSEGFSGGIPFLPREMNVSLGRVIFGLGALICFAMFLWALKRFFGSHK